VFLDEPTIGLDVIAKDKIREFILEMNKQGVTFILTTHDLDDVERLAQRVIVINHGQIVFDNSIDALRKHFGEKKWCLYPLTIHYRLWTCPSTGKKQNIEYNAELELDVSKLELNKFIDYINKNSTINDLLVQSLPIED